MREVVNKFRFRRGGASLLTTMVLAVALLSIISGLTVLSVHELRQAANNEQSKRALGGAESYISKLANQIDSTTVSTSACNADPGAPTVAKPPFPLDATTNNLFITCSIIKTGASNETVGVLNRDESFKIDLSKAYKDNPATPVNVAKMSIEWDKDGDSNDHNAGQITAAYPAGSWPKLGAGNLSVPAAPELTYVWWSVDPAGKLLSLTSGEDFGLMPIKKVVIKPANSIPSTDMAGAHSAVCGPSASYTCKVTTFRLNDFASGIESFQNKIFKLTARYNTMHFSLRFYDDLGNLLMLPQPMATIDVTAKSGNLYRRVIAQKPLTTSTSQSYLDSVIFSGRGICKDMKLGFDHGLPTMSDNSIAPGATGKNTCDN